MLPKKVPKVYKKNQEKLGPVSLLIQKLEIQNLRYSKISHKEVGKYPIAANPYLEL